MTDAELKIRTEHVYPPIPIRSMDWCAWRDGDEPNDSGQMKYIGWGPTEADAIQDLRDQIEADQPPTHCSYCGKPAATTMHCGMGSCPLGADL